MCSPSPPSESPRTPPALPSARGGMEQHTSQGTVIRHANAPPAPSRPLRTYTEAPCALAQLRSPPRAPAHQRSRRAILTPPTLLWAPPCAARDKFAAVRRAKGEGRRARHGVSGADTFYVAPWRLAKLHEELSSGSTPQMLSKARQAPRRPVPGHRARCWRSRSWSEELQRSKICPGSRVGRACARPPGAAFPAPARARSSSPPAIIST